VVAARAAAAGMIAAAQARAIHRACSRQWVSLNFSPLSGDISDIHDAPDKWHNVGMQRRYSPAECVGTTFGTVTGNPDRKHGSTSYTERQNLSMRMGIRRFTRLTNAFSKKVQNHIYALAIYSMHYNYVRIHQSLRVTRPWPQACPRRSGPWTTLWP
jgi:hypothetical protein